MTERELKRIPQIKHLEEQRRQQYKRLMGYATRIGGSQDNERVQTSDKKDFSFYVADAADIKEEADALHEQASVLIREAHRVIEQIPDTNKKLILMYRYEFGMDWRTVADLVGYDIHYIFRIHREAVEEYFD